jgi:hypothetical protein
VSRAFLPRKYCGGGGATAAAFQVARAVRLDRIGNPMRRLTLLLGGLLLIIVALPLLPGPGWLMIARVVAVLEREFIWVRRLLDRLESRMNRRPAAAPSGIAGRAPIGSRG